MEGGGTKGKVNTFSRRRPDEGIFRQESFLGGEKGGDNRSRVVGSDRAFLIEDGGRGGTGRSRDLSGPERTTVGYSSIKERDEVARRARSIGRARIGKKKKV